MVEFKLTLNDPKTGKSYQKEVKDQAAKSFVGLKIGDSIKGEVIDLAGYEFLITGGSDKSGFPMRHGIITPRKRIYAGIGVGIGKKSVNEKGMIIRKTVCGHTISDNISQINLKVTKPGRELLGAGKEASEKEKGETKEKKSGKEENKQ